MVCWNKNVLYHRIITIDAANYRDAMPAPAPNAHGNPRAMPAADPVAVIITLLHPGVISATSEKIRKGMVCSSVTEPTVSLVPPW
jgi:hypothetical protein